MFNTVKELLSSLKRNSLKSYVVFPLLRKFQVCAAEKKDEESFRGQWA